jgi:tetratricopeptide (TPR) repeat protein
MSMSDSTLLGVALRARGFEVLLDQLEPNNYSFKTDDIVRFVSQIADCHLFMYVFTPSSEDGSFWIALEREIAMIGAANLELQLVALAQAGDSLRPPLIADIVVDARGALSHARRDDGSWAGSTVELDKRLADAHLGYAGLVLSEQVQTELADLLREAAADERRPEDALQLLSKAPSEVQGTQEYRLAWAAALAGMGRATEAARIALELADLQRSRSSARTIMGACDILETLGYTKEALAFWTPIVRVFHLHDREPIKDRSRVYPRAHLAMARLLARMGAREAAFNHVKLVKWDHASSNSRKMSADCDALGRLLAQQEAEVEALWWFALAVALDGDFVSAREGLSRCMTRLGQGGHAARLVNDLKSAKVIGDVIDRVTEFCASADPSADMSGVVSAFECDQCGAWYSSDIHPYVVVCPACGGGTSPPVCEYCGYDRLVACNQVSEVLCPICAGGFIRPV